MYNKCTPRRRDGKRRSDGKREALVKVEPVCVCVWAQMSPAVWPGVNTDGLWRTSETPKLPLTHVYTFSHECSHHIIYALSQNLSYYYYDMWYCTPLKERQFLKQCFHEGKVSHCAMSSYTSTTEPITNSLYSKHNCTKIYTKDHFQIYFLY